MLVVTRVSACWPAGSFLPDARCCLYSNQANALLNADPAHCVRDRGACGSMSAVLVGFCQWPHRVSHSRCTTQNTSLTHAAQSSIIEICREYSSVCLRLILYYPCNWCIRLISPHARILVLSMLSHTLHSRKLGGRLCHFSFFEQQCGSLCASIIIRCPGNSQSTAQAPELRYASHSYALCIYDPDAYPAHPMPFCPPASCY